MEISTKITQLQDARHTAVRRMRELLDTADADGDRDLTAEERQEYNRLEETVDANGVRIETETKLRNSELELEQRDGDGRQFQGDHSDRSDSNDEAYTHAFANYLRNGDI